MNDKGKAKQPKQKEKTMTVKKEDDLRKVARLKEEHEITITIVSEDENLPKENILYNLSKDISESGVRIQGNIPLPVDTLLRIDLTIESLHQKITAFGKVKWIKSNIEAGTYEAGVEFVDTSGEAIRKIEDYILRKQKYTNLNPVGVPFWIFAKFNSAKEK
jgi:c-di-GMP-binding flagellar brake protein YcgR